VVGDVAFEVVINALVSDLPVTTRPDQQGPPGAVVEAEAPGVSLGVSVPDLDATVAQVADLGEKLLMPPTDNGWVTKALMTDPAGNPLTLIADRPSPGR
jgi:predicted enzyme related to lactoylglutathione lyase